MRGIVIKRGLIGANDGRHYAYEGYENLSVGDKVDFVGSDDGRATEIFVIEKSSFKASDSSDAKFSGGEFYNTEFSENKYSDSEFFKNGSGDGNDSNNGGGNGGGYNGNGFSGGGYNNAGGYNNTGGFYSSPQDLGSVKLFGILGSLIGLCSAIFYVGWFFAFCAFLLVLLALHNAAKISGSQTLFVNYLKGIIANFVGIGFIWLGVILGAVLFFTSGSSGIIGIFVGLFGVFLLLYAFSNWIKTYFELSYLSGNNMFKYFAIIYIIGVCTTWLFGLGYIVMGIAFGLQAFGWWQLSSLKRLS